MIAVGLVPKLYDLDHQPGWLQHSVAFHADDGKYVTSSSKARAPCVCQRKPGLVAVRLNLLLSTHCVDCNIVLNDCVCTCATLFRAWKRLNRLNVFFCY